MPVNRPYNIIHYDILRDPIPPNIQWSQIPPIYSQYAAPTTVEEPPDQLPYVIHVYGAIPSQSYHGDLWDIAGLRTHCKPFYIDHDKAIYLANALSFYGRHHLQVSRLWIPPHDK